VSLDSGDIQLLHKAMERLTAANGALAFLSDHFRDKYNLAPGQQITPDGRIVPNSGIEQKEKLNAITQGQIEEDHTREYQNRN
jgi:hypothetical protein